LTPEIFEDADPVFSVNFLLNQNLFYNKHSGIRDYYMSFLSNLKSMTKQRQIKIKIAGFDH